jgi:hypothetical protein
MFDVGIGEGLDGESVEPGGGASNDAVIDGPFDDRGGAVGEFGIELATVPDKPGVAVEDLISEAPALLKVSHGVHNRRAGAIHLLVVVLVGEVPLPPFPSQPLWHPTPQWASEFPQKPEDEQQPPAGQLPQVELP